MKKIITKGIMSNEFDYIEKIKYLFKEEGYYLNLQRLNKKNIKKDYWTPKSDPDGNLRKLLSEKQSWITNNIETIKFIEKHITFGSNKNINNKSILDIGAGPGWLLDCIFKNQAHNFKYFSIENSQLSIESQPDFIHNYKYFSNNLMQRQFDFIIMNHVIEHIKSPINFFLKSLKLLKSKGILVLGTPDFYSAMAIKYRDKYRMLNEPTHISLFSQDSIIRLLRDCGLTILDVQFPFFDSPYFTKKNILSILDSNKVSPPFHGNYILISARK